MAFSVASLRPCSVPTRRLSRLPFRPRNSPSGKPPEYCSVICTIALDGASGLSRTSSFSCDAKAHDHAYRWNWNIETNLDAQALSTEAITVANNSFVPMLWGQATPPDYDFLKFKDGHLMGYNEPDLYGPACCNCDGKQSYYPATSSGWLPLFNPASAVTFWATTVNSLTNPSKPGTTMTKIVSPAMANDATPAPGVDCTADPAQPGNPNRCEGWLSMFKKLALTHDCTSFDGNKTNCWDVIDALSIHAYARRPEVCLRFALRCCMQCFCGHAVPFGAISASVHINCHLTEQSSLGCPIKDQHVLQRVPRGF